MWAGLALPSAHLVPETGLSLLLGCSLGSHARNLTRPRWGRQHPLHRPKRAGSLGWRLPGTSCTLACCPSGQSLPPHTQQAGPGPSAGAPRLQQAGFLGAGLNAEAPVGVQGPQLAGTAALGLPRLTSCSHCPRPPSPSDLRCALGGGGPQVMALDFVKAAQGFPLAASPGAAIPQTPGLQPLATRMTGLGPGPQRLCKGSSQEGQGPEGSGQGSRPYKSWAATQEAFLPFTPPPRSPGAGRGPGCASC